MAECYFYGVKKKKRRIRNLSFFLLLDLAAPVSHVKFSEQGVGLTLELKQNVVNTVVCARIGMSQGDRNPFVQSKAENRCNVSL